MTLIAALVQISSALSLLSCGDAVSSLVQQPAICLVKTNARELAAGADGPVHRIAVGKTRICGFIATESVRYKTAILPYR
jgi:hypothetical protein